MTQSSHRSVRTLTAALILLASHLCPGAALAQGAPDDPRAARVDALFNELNRRDGPGAAVVVVRNGKVLLRRGYGLADLKHHVPVTPSTVFDTASLSKQFTGLAVAMLVTEGKIKLSDDIRKYIPKLPDTGRPVTVSQLLHHTSGVRDWGGTLSVAGWRPDDPITFKQILTMAYSQRSSNFVPGAEHLYSNTGYNLLAEMVQRVTGSSFRAWTDEHIFRPLGMNNTHVRDDYKEVIADRASGYARAPDGSYRNTPDNLVAFGSSSVFSTADDFARWLINFNGMAVGGRDALAMMLEPATLNDGTLVNYGFGITHGANRYKGLPFFTSSGEFASFNCFDAYFPEQKFGVIVLANTSESVISAQDAVIKITDIYLEKEFAATKPSDVPAPAPSRNVSLIPALLDQYAGVYRLGADSFMRVQRLGTVLLSQIPHQGVVVMSPRSDREFWVEREEEGAAVSFLRDAAGKVTALEYRGQRAPKLNQSDLRPPARLADYAGDYDTEELGTSYRVVVKNGALEMQHRRRGPVPLSWLWKDEFGSLDAYFGSVDFLRDAAGRVTGLVVNGSPRSRDLRFVKRQ